MSDNDQGLSDWEPRRTDNYPLTIQGCLIGVLGLMAWGLVILVMFWLSPHI